MSLKDIKNVLDGIEKSLTERSSFGFKRPATSQEKRAASALEKERGPVKVRAKRKSKNLPSEYDDVYRSDVSSKSWKKHRKHQYRVK